MPPLHAGSPADLSASLKRLAQGGGAKLSLGEIVEPFEAHGGLAQVLFILTLPVLLPLPPGASALLALPLLVVAPQMAAGRKVLWLPRWLAARTLDRKPFAKLVRRILPLLTWIEARGKPRLAFMTGEAGARVVGVIATLIAMIVVLPIPFANLLPALALGLLALGLARQDGLLVSAGYGMFALAVAVMALGADGAVFLFHRLMALR